MSFTPKPKDFFLRTSEFFRDFGTYLLKKLKWSRDGDLHSEFLVVILPRVLSGLAKSLSSFLNRSYDISILFNFGLSNPSVNERVNFNPGFV